MKHYQTIFAVWVSEAEGHWVCEDVHLIESLAHGHLSRYKDDDTVMTRIVRTVLEIESDPWVTE